MASPYFTVLGEDKAHDLFVYRLLLSWGVIRQRIRVVPYPAGAGSGEQHVREELPIYLQALRTSKLKRFLVAVTDADSLTVPNRRNQLERRLDDEGVARPAEQDPVAILIPKRTIEAWLHFLQTGQSDEESRLDASFEARIADACKEAPTRLDSWLDQDHPDGPDSLMRGRDDLIRLRAAARS